MIRFCFIGLLALCASPAFAQSQDEVLQGALLSGWQMPDGRQMAALHLTLAPAWKTYWRAPGEAGIPPRFNWSGSQNVQAVALHWPSPAVFRLNGMQSIGYHDALVLPLEVTAIDPAQPIALHLRMDLGICEDICMPATLTLQADLSGPGAPNTVIAAALAAAPLTAAEAGLQAMDCRITPIPDGLRIEASMTLPRQGTPETVVFETSDRSVWIDEAIASRDQGTLTATTELVPDKAAPFALDRSDLTVTVIGQGRSVEIKGCPSP